MRGTASPFAYVANLATSLLVVSMATLGPMAAPGAVRQLEAGSSAVDSPLANPTANRPTPADVYGAGSPCVPAGGDDWAACNRIFLAAINAAQVSEHRRGFTLPSNFLSLTPAQQMFVWVNLERISRGVPPLVGLSPYLSEATTRAAKTGTYVRFQSSYGPVKVAVSPQTGNYAWSGFQAGGSGLAMAAGAVFLWMYQDGWAGAGGVFGGTANGSCTSPKAAGCWRDRDNLLGVSTGLACSDCIAGAASAPVFLTTWSFLLVRPVHFPAPVNFTWDTNVLPYLPPGYERVAAVHREPVVPRVPQRSWSSKGNAHEFEPAVL